MKDLPVTFRAPDPGDTSFIFNSWLKSYRKSDFAKHMCNSIYHKTHSKIITRLLSESLVIIACNPDDPEQIYGYMVYEEIAPSVFVLHYIYVKFNFRKLGIAGQMLKTLKSDTPVLYSHHTSIMKKIKSVDLLYDIYRGLK